MLKARAWQAKGTPSHISWSKVLPEGVGDLQDAFTGQETALNHPAS